MKRYLTIAMLLTAFCGSAYAQTADDPDPSENRPVEEEEPNDGDLPPPQSDDDPQPEVPTPGVPPGGLVEQAGVGGVTGYGRAGVLELGGSAGFTAGTGLTQVNVAPSIGWFAADNLELTGILDLAHVQTDTEEGTLVTVLVEPSYHLPFNRTTFGFFGLGVGTSYVDGPGMAFAMAPRLGGNFLVGRSGILTPSVSWQYNTHDAMDTPQGALLQVSSAVRANIGYTVMW
jgi:hypothetical protein